MTDRTKRDLAIYGNQQLDRLGADFRNFVEYLWTLSHQGQLDTFAFDGDDPTLLSLIMSGVLEIVDERPGVMGKRRFLRFNLDIRQCLEYVERGKHP
jgi:hypothetical protein